MRNQLVEAYMTDDMVHYREAIEYLRVYADAAKVARGAVKHGAIWFKSQAIFEGSRRNAKLVLAHQRKEV